MTAYRRNFVPGGCFFFTVNLAERKLSLLTDHVELLRAAFRETRQRHPFTIDAIAVLPDHLHTVWTLPEGDADFATRWQLIKSAFSRRMARNEGCPEAAQQKANGAPGNADVGNILFATKSILPGMSTMFISIRSSTGSSTGFAIGRRPRFIAT